MTTKGKDRRSNKPAKKNKGGRPKAAWRDNYRWRSKISPEMIDKLCAMVQVGGDETVAARSCGINPSTLSRWKKRGNEALARCVDADGDYDLDQLPDESCIYAVCVLCLGQAKARREQGIKEKIQFHGEKDWRALAWLLEKEDPGKYGQKVSVESRSTMKIEEDVRIEARLEVLSADELRALAGLLGKLDEASRGEGAGEEVVPGLRAVHDAGVPRQLASPDPGGEAGEGEDG